MAQWKIYYNPQCSKCRETLALLRARQIEPQVIEYLKDHITEQELEEIISKLGTPASSIVRTKEEEYQKLQFDLESKTAIIENIRKNPKLLERPIVIKDDQAVIARPVEKVEKLLCT